MRNSERKEAEVNTNDSFSLCHVTRLFFYKEEGMDNRIAVIAMIVEDLDAADELNRILHEYGSYVIGRMGIPYRERSISLISVAVDAPTEVISAMTGKLGALNGVSVKTAYSKS